MNLIRDVITAFRLARLGIEITLKNPFFGFPVEIKIELNEELKWCILFELWVITFLATIGRIHGA